MPRIQYISDITGGFEEAHGSDSRLNVSSRADGRGYYNSRDESESYSLTFDDDNATVNDYVVYLKNTKTDGKHLVIRSASVNGEVNSSFEFLKVTGTPGGGAVAATPTNLNFAGVAKSATADSFTVADSGASPISGLVAGDEFDHVQVIAGGHEEFRFQDQLRVGQNQAVAIRMKKGTADSYCFGVIFFYFE